MKKLDVKAYKLHKLADYIGVIFLVMLLLFIWQLYRGPIAMPFLKPYIIKALNHDDTEYQVTLDSVNLELVRSIKPLRIIATNVVYRKTDDEIIINAPKTSVSFSIKALLRGVIAPSSIEVIKPTVYIFNNYGVEKDKQDQINQKKLEYYFEGMQDFLERFNSEDKSYPESYINDIDIKGAEVELHEVDLGRKWVLSDVNYRFDRNLTSLETEVSALLKFNDVPSSIGVEAVYRPLSNKVALQFYFSDLVPSELMNILDAQNRRTASLKVDMPLNGKLNVLINVDEVIKNKANLIKGLDAAIEKIRFELEGGKGHIDFDGTGRQNYNLSSLLLSGEISGGLDKINVKDATLDIDGQKAVLDVEASGFNHYFLKSSPDDLKVALKVGVASVKIDDLYHYWPEYIATKAWKWCRESLLGGRIADADFTFNFAYDKKSKKFAFKDLSGSAKVEDGTLDYLTGMPKITGIYGKADFYNDSIKLTLDKGVSDDVILTNGFVDLYELDKEDNFAKVSLLAVGSVSDVLKLIDHQPLGYASDMGIEPDSIKGSATTSLDLAFELKENLEPDEVTVNVKSELQDVVLPGIIADKSVEAKKLNLEVTNQGLLITGVTNFEGIPVNLLWNENFANKNYKSRYQLSFNFDANLKSKLGIDFAALSAPYIQGSIPTEAIITAYDGGRTTIDVRGNLRSSNIDYAFLGFKKVSGTPASATALIEVDKDRQIKIPNFSLSKPDFKLSGKVDFYPGNEVKLVDIANIKGPKTFARAKIEFITKPEEKVKVTVSGDSYNLSDFFAKDEQEVQASKERRKKLKRSAPVEDDNDTLEDVTTTDINIAVNSLWTNNDVAIRNFAGSAKLVHGIGLQEMHLIGNFNSSRKKARSAHLKLDYIPRPDKEYLLSIESNDAGSTMKFLRLYDYMRGGTLSINAKRGADKRFVGHAKIRDFNIYNTPVLAKLLTVASFTGMVNLLTGEGLAFSHFDAPFEYYRKVLRVNDAKAFGNVVGITGSGNYYARYQEFDIKGLIAPAYGLNTFIGSLPIVGSLLSGKDGTVFAANYKITGDIDDPVININPLSALSPNSLKELMSSIFGSKNE